MNENVGMNILAVLVAAFALGGCGSRGETPDQTSLEVVYVCTETQEAFVGPPETPPLQNPDTGRKTLVPAIYNPRTARWQALPPLELLEGNLGAAVSKNHDQPLTLAGPKEGLRRLAPGKPD